MFYLIQGRKLMLADGSGATRAPLRWAGSKRKSIPALRRYLPRETQHYVEPFAGSACLAFDVRPKQFVLGDLNPQLIEFYSYLKSSPGDLYELYASHEQSEENYYKIRSSYNESRSGIERAAKFLYLNRNCFNGIYRVNTSGKFNVPWGGEKIGKALSRDDLIAASRFLQSGQFMCSDFEEVVKLSVKEGTVVYLDPPYANDKVRVFREYHESSFSIDDWSRLIELLRFIESSGAHFVLSYAGPSYLSGDLQEWNVGYLDVMRNVGGFRATRRRYREFLATNLPNIQ